MSVKEYAIWLNPSGDEFKALIQKYCQEYHTPYFEPHITLVAGINGDKDSIAERVKLLSKEISPFQVTINKISHSEYYYRCVILELVLTHELEQALKTTKKLFDISDTLTFLPHISIVYGDMNIKDRSHISTELNYMLYKTTRVENLTLLHASTDMPPEDWRTVLRCNL